jgi:hypothetical protein
MHFIHCIKTLEISEYSNVSFVNIYALSILISLYGNERGGVAKKLHQSTIDNGQCQFQRRDFQWRIKFSMVIMRDA